MPKTSTIAGIAVGTVVAAGLAVGAYMLMSKKSSKAGKGSKKRGKRAGGGGKRGGVSLEVLLQMFDEIIAQMKVVKQKLDQIKLQIKRDAAAKGQQVNDAEIDGMIAQQFAEAMKSIEAKIYERHGVKQAEVEKATETHSADGKYEAKVKELQELFNSIHPQEAAAGVQLPAAAQADIEAITMDVVVKAVEDSMAAVNNFVRTDLVERIKTGLPNKAYFLANTVMSSINDDDIKKASLLQKTTAAGIMIDKARLIDGQSTENQAVWVKKDITIKTKVDNLEAKRLAIEADIQRLESK